MKKILSIALALTLLISCVPIEAFATERTKTGTATATLTVENAYSSAGGEVEVNIVLADNPGIAGATLSISYHKDLKLVSVATGDALSELEFSGNEVDSFSNPSTFSWDSESGESFGNGVMLKLTFIVDKNAAYNSKLDISVSYRDGDIYNETQDLELEIINGSVIVIDYIPGDLFEDGVINTKDVRLIRQLINGNCSVEVNEAAADVNDDGVVNTKDTRQLRRYINGGYGVVLLPSTPKCSHVMEEIPFKAATCTEPGNGPYYHCTSCDKSYKDSTGTTEIDPSKMILPATGHNEVIDPAVEPTYDDYGWTEGSHCSVCNKILKAQERIDKLKSEEYLITYKLPSADTYLEEIKAADRNTNPTTYTADKGIDYIEDLEIPGYTFHGWYTEPEGKGQRVSSIPVGSTGRKTLYAHMTPRVYKITFDTPDVDVYGTKITGESVKNYTEYTVNTGVTLTNPEWYGYTFVGWSNDDGFIVSRIKPGTTGDFTLHANWTSNRNIATSYKSYGEPIIIEDAANGQFLFVYNIGKIENVPLNEIPGSYFHNIGSTTFNKKLQISSSVNEEFVDSINSMISNATTRSSGWTLEEGWEDIYTSGEETGKLSEKSDERTSSDGTVVGDKYFVSNSEGGSTHVSTESGSASSNSSKVTTENSMGLNQSYDTSTEKYCDAQLGVKTHAGVTNETELSAGVEVPVGVAKVSAGVKNTTTIEASTDTEMGVQSGRKDNEAYHVDGSYSAYVGTVNTSDSSSYYNSAVSSGSNWNSQTGYEQSKETSHNESVTNAIKEQLSEKSTHTMSKALSGSGSETESKEESQMSSEEYATSFTYGKQASETVTETVTQNFTVNGHYRYITAGTIHVYGVVGYDVANASYYTYCFNVLDDNTRQIWDYSKDDKFFNDCENGIVTFEVPYEIQEYVAGMMGRTNGLEIGYDGVVSDFEAQEDFNGTVVIPQYASKNNHDGTYTFAKITSFNGGTFENVKNDLEVVVLPMYVTEIPDNAFAGCTKLKTVIAYGVTKIGANAFKGCTSLEKFYVDNCIVSLGNNAFEGVNEVAITAYDSAVVDAALKSGAKKITLNVSHIKDKIDNKVISVPSSVESFTLIGDGSTYNNVSVKSDAAETMISNMVFANNKSTPIELSSSKVTLARVTVDKAPGFAVILKANDVQMKLLGENKISTSSENAIISRSAALSKLDQSTTSKLILSGNYLVCGSIENSGMLTYTNGKTITLTEDQYASMLTSSILTLDPNGGTVDVTEKVIYYEQPYGELPTPSRTGYDFKGWFTEKTGGTQVTASSVVKVLANQTLYAQWTAKTYKVSWDTGTGYTINVKRTSSPYAGAATGALTNGAAVYYGDVLEVTYIASTGYSITSKGSTSITVTGNVTKDHIYAAAKLNEYKVSWDTGIGYSIEVSSSCSYPGHAHAAVMLQSGSTVHYGEVLNVIYKADTGYTINSHGSTSITVSGNVTKDQIYATASVNAYKVTWDAPVNCSIVVKRTSSPLKGAANGQLKNGDAIYHGDVLSVTYTANNGYSLSSKGSTSITVSGNVTKDQIKASASPNDYTYNIVYKSSNGTNLGTATVTYKYGTTNTITAPGKSGYNTPAAQSVKWDSTSAKTIEFIYAPTSVGNTHQSGYINYNASSKYYLAYDVTIEHRNRTANSVELRVVWTATLSGSAVYNSYGQRFSAWVGSVGTGDVAITQYGTWKSPSSSARSATGYSGWIKVPLGTTNATSVNMGVYYYQVNANGTDMTKYYGESGLNTTWSISIPAY